MQEKKVQNLLSSCKTCSLFQATGKSKVLEGRLRGVSSRIQSALSKEIEERQRKSKNKKIDDQKNDQI